MGTTGWLVIAAAAWIAAITTWNLLVVPWLKAGPRRDVVYVNAASRVEEHIPVHAHREL